MIAAVVLAAGLSTRMGRPKLILPWGSTTIIGQVVVTLKQAGIGEIIVVTGGARQEVAAAVEAAIGSAARTVFNPHYAEGDMVISLRVGMNALSDAAQAMLVTLGDQPQIDADVVCALLDAYRPGQDSLIIPSFQMRRGHPWMVDRSLWPDLFSAPHGFTMRDFVKAHQKQITYLPVETSSILRDVDTPDDYDRERNPK
jgi:molybdenum cofactor cytidylyltransferase